MQLLVLSGVIAACSAPLGTVSPESTDPVATLPSETGEATPVISTKPAGAGVTPGTEIVSTPSPETGITPEEIFVQPSLEDLAKVTGAEAVPPDSIKDYVNSLKQGMADPQIRAEVARQCGVDANTLKAEYKEGSIENEFRWTVVFEGVGADGQTVTCWATNSATGELTPYPTLFDIDSSRVLGEQDGVSWTPISGEMDWAGTVPVAIDPETRKWLVPGGSTLESLADLDSWDVFENDEVVLNPIAPENMSTLLDAGYKWQNNSLINRDGYIVLTLENNQLVDPRTGEVTAVSELQLNETTGVDFGGREIVTILTRNIDGETKFYNPVIDAWVTPIDVAGSQRTIDRPDLPPATFEKWRDPKEVVIENLPVITWDDFHSGRLFYSELLNLKPWPENVRDSNFAYRQLPVLSNVWTLTQYSDIQEGMLSEGQRPILAENDPVINLGGYRMESPTNGAPMIVKSQQYLIDGQTYVLHLFFTDELANPNNPEIDLVQQSLSSPSMRITEPIVNIRPEDWCGEGGLGYEVAQPTVCTLQGYDYLAMPRTVLPTAVQNTIARYDVEGQLAEGDHTSETFPVGGEVALLQQLPLPQSSFDAHAMQYYLRSEDDPVLKP
jgi:hypothetical protein